MRATRYIKLRLMFAVWCAVTAPAAFASERALAIDIVIDYRYDNGVTPFFNTQAKDALQAAADRFSNIITTFLSAANLSDGGSNDPRIGFTHPTTGASFQVSSAIGAASDFLVTNAGAAVANEYRGSWTIDANKWILYAGGRSLTSAAVGGDRHRLESRQHFFIRKLASKSWLSALGRTQHLPVWGGSISFDNDGSTIWHFDLNTQSSGSSIDFYSIALHEIGHALGLSANWLDWTSNTNVDQYIGPDAVNAYNDDNDPDVESLDLVSASNHHWENQMYQSYIFQNGTPNLVGTVGIGAKQDLIMDPTANFTPTIKRFEMTNVDVAALSDVGWSVIPEINLQLGDYNGDGIVDAADYVEWRKGTASGNYATWRANFAEPLTGSGGIENSSSGVPEPVCLAPSALWLLIGFTSFRRRRVAD